MKKRKDKRDLEKEKAKYQKYLREKDRQVFKRIEIAEGNKELEGEIKNIEEEIQDVEKEINEEDKKVYKEAVFSGTTGMDITTKTRMENKCEQIISEFLEVIQPNIQKEEDVKGSILNVEVQFGTSISILELADWEMTFFQLRKEVSAYYSIPPTKFFFKDHLDRILMNEMQVKDTLFPLQTARIKFEKPRVFVILQRDINPDNIIPNEEEEEEEEKNDDDEDERAKHLEELKRKEIFEMKKEVERKEAAKIRKKKLLAILEGVLFITMVILFFVVTFQTNYLAVVVIQHEPLQRHLLDHITDTAINPEISFYDWIEDHFIVDLIEEKSFFLKRKMFLPYAQLRQVRVKDTVCATGRSKLDETLFERETPCIPFYVGENKLTEDFGDETTTDLDYFRYDSSKNGTDNNKGWINILPRDGFVVEFPILSRNEAALVRDLFQELKDNSWIDQQTKGLIITLNLADPSHNIFHIFRIVFMFPTIGNCIPDIETFFFYAGNVETTTLGYQILTGCLSIVVLILQGVQLTFKKTLHHKKKKKNIKERCARFRRPTLFEILSAITVLMLDFSFVCTKVYTDYVDSLDFEQDNYIELSNYAAAYAYLASYYSFVMIILNISFIRYCAVLYGKVDFVANSIFKYIFSFVMTSSVFVFSLILVYAFYLQYSIGENIFPLYDYGVAVVRSLEMFMTGIMQAENLGNYFVGSLTGWSIIGNKFESVEYAMKKSGPFIFLGMVIGFVFVSKYIITAFIVSQVVKHFRQTRTKYELLAEEQLLSNQALAKKMMMSRKNKQLKLIIEKSNLEEKAKKKKENPNTEKKEEKEIKETKKTKT